MPQMTMSIASGVGLGASRKSGERPLRRGRDQAEARDHVRVPRGGFQRESAPIVWPTSRRFSNAGRRDDAPSSPRARRSPSAARPPSGRGPEVGRQHAAAVMRKRSGNGGPDPMIHAGPVQENDGSNPVRPRRRPRQRPSVCQRRGAWRLQAFCDARSACSRSATMSSTPSRPTDRRTMSSPTPAAASCSADIC